MRAADGTQLDPGDIAAMLLRQLGAADEQIPDSPFERASQLRSLTMDRRLLVVLDNVFPDPLINELIPANPRCAVILTSHDPIAGVDPDLELELGGFSDEDALEFIDAVAGGDRIAVEPGPALELVRMCGNLPVRLRAVANWLRASSQASVEEAAARLKTSGYDPSAPEAFALPYALLSSRAAELLRALGTVRANDVTLGAAQALSGQNRTETAALLREIHRAGLIEMTQDDRAQMHELMLAGAEAAAETIADSQGEPNG
jgi:hypothetical protein